jgi:hypothetical protein
MNRLYYPVSLLICLALAFSPKLGAQQPKPFTTVVDSSPEILVCEFETARPAPAGQDYEVEAAHVRITQVLKDANRLGLAPGEADVTIRRSYPVIGVSSHREWAGHDSTPGRTYLILSNSKDPRAVIEEPASVDQVTGDADVLADVELNLHSASLPVSAQAQAAAISLGGPSVHSRFMAEYVAWLLGVGSDLETKPLLDALENRGAAAFTEDARMSLLEFLRVKFLVSSAPSDNLVRALTGSTLRSLIAEKEDLRRRGRPSRTRIGVLEEYLPLIWKSPRALAALRQAPLTKSELEQAKVKASEFAADTRLSPAWRAQARDLAILLDNR